MRWQRKTDRRARLAAQMLAADRDGEPIYGYDTSRRAHVRSGTLYAALTRMLRRGWVTDGWDGNRPRRRFYFLTDEGRDHLQRGDLP